IDRQMDEHTEGFEINTLMGELKLFRGIDEEVKDIEAEELQKKEEMVQTISLMVGKLSGDVERVFIDVRRDGFRKGDLEELLSMLVQGKPLEKGEVRVIGDFVAESMEIDGVDIIHISKGKESIQKIKEPAELLEAWHTYMAEEWRVDRPVGIEAGLLLEMENDERRVFIERYAKGVAMLGSEEDAEKAMEGLEKFSEILNGNRARYESLEKEYKMLLTRRGSSLEVKDAVKLMAQGRGLGRESGHIFDLARFIASVGKTQAGKDRRANELFMRIFKEMYEAGDLPEDLLRLLEEEMPLAALLESDGSLFIPPIKTNRISDVESYIRARKYVQTMA
ncbi:MAG: hypothetical protein Q8Q33_08535, partial [Chlamydiota bacterium]|nr:hypothetical protein [Chlamydiota bacterium]